MTAASSITPVAARGLWDKFAPPGSLGAIRRSYARGVASVVDTAALRLEDVLPLVLDPGVNRRRRPVHLVASALPSPALLTHVGHEPGLFVTIAGRPDQPWRLWRWTGSDWVPAGVYLPAVTVATGRHDGWPTLAPPATVLYESPNVATVLAERARLEHADERALAATIRAYAGDDATVARVSDFVEAELLQAVSEGA
jgi:hypothetical protein